MSISLFTKHAIYMVEALGRRVHGRKLVKTRQLGTEKSCFSGRERQHLGGSCEEEFDFKAQLG